VPASVAFGSVPLRWHSATALAPDSLLVVGGIGNGLPVTDTSLLEVHFPPELLLPLPRLSEARTGHCALPLPVGRVLVLGGAAGAAPERPEVLARSGRIWTPDGSALASPRVAPACVLADPAGVVLIAGDARPGRELDRSAELRTPEGLWVAAATSAEPHGGGAGVAILGGRAALVAGGPNARGSEVFDFATGTWSTNAPFFFGPRVFHTLTLLDDGRVLMAGGLPANGTSTPTTSTEIYDPTRGTWLPTGPLAAARFQHVAFGLAGGRVLVAGGNAGPPVIERLTSSEIFEAGSWRPTGDLRFGRAEHAGILLDDGRPLVAGGYLESNSQLDSIEVFDPSMEQWWLVDVPLPSVRSGLSATRVGPGRVVFAGGVSDGTVSADAQLLEIFP
jgi:hypothetical protein